MHSSFLETLKRRIYEQSSGVSLETIAVGLSANLRREAWKAAGQQKHKRRGVVGGKSGGENGGRNLLQFSYGQLEISDNADHGCLKPTFKFHEIGNEFQANIRNEGQLGWAIATLFPCHDSIGQNQSGILKGMESSGTDRETLRQSSGMGSGKELYRGLQGIVVSSQQGFRGNPGPIL